MRTPHILRVACPQCFHDGYLLEEWKPLENNEDAIQNFDLKSLKWGCETCDAERWYRDVKYEQYSFDIHDLNGQCITCDYNKGCCLAGGTRNFMTGAICTNKELIEERDWACEDDDIEDGACVYRIEEIVDNVCEYYKKNVETFRLYLGTNMKVI